jgi:hypothetical protein
MSLISSKLCTLWPPHANDDDIKQHYSSLVQTAFIIFFNTRRFYDVRNFNSRNFASVRRYQLTKQKHFRAQ